MSCVMLVHGRGGDIVMSMGAASLISEITGEKPVIAVAPRFKFVADMLVDIAMPLSGVVAGTNVLEEFDKGVFGSSVSRWSDAMVRNLLGDYERCFNCCPGSVPEGVHMYDFMTYLTGLNPTLNRNSHSSPSRVARHRGGDGTVVYHFGGSNESKMIFMSECPFPEYRSVFVGLSDDPIMDWPNCVDLRGSSLADVVSTLSSCEACVGSDSLVTHVSSLIGVPTAALHNDMRSIVMSNRNCYIKGASIPSSEGKEVIRKVICLLSGNVVASPSN